MLNKVKSRILSGKKQVMTIGIVVLFAFGSVTFVGCGSKEDHSEGDGHEHAVGETHEHAEGEEHEHHDAEHAHYVCPMDCEKGKTYEEPGTCPKCEMDLVGAEG